MKTPIGEKIKQARVASKLTQKELAARLQCTEVMISRYELGAVVVSVEKLQKLATILDKQMGYFFDLDDTVETTIPKKSEIKKVFVFDLDDTLVDGRKFCGETIARAITAQIPSADFDLICQIHDAIRGMAIDDLYITILKDLNLKADLTKLLAYDRLIQQESIYKMKLFDGVVEMLDFLKTSGKQLYICTNRSKSLLDKVLSENKIAHFFDDVISCLDAGFKKPNPYCLTKLIEKTGIPSSQFIYFGDSVVDSQFAQNAGIEHIVFDQYMNNNNLFQKLVNMFLEGKKLEVW